VSTNEDGGAAFPGSVVYDGSRQEVNLAGVYYDLGGMSLRDYFAAHADVPWNAVIETIMKNYGVEGKTYTIGELMAYRASMCYAQADAMLKERKK